VGVVRLDLEPEHGRVPLHGSTKVGHIGANVVKTRVHAFIIPQRGSTISGATNRSTLDGYASSSSCVRRPAANSDGTTTSTPSAIFSWSFRGVSAGERHTLPVVRSQLGRHVVEVGIAQLVVVHEHKSPEHNRLI